MLQCSCNDYVEQVGTQTCCNAHMKFATTGLFVADVTPSQIVVTAAVAVSHTASLKSQHARAPPAIGIPCCAVPASVGVCATVRTQTRYSEYSHGVLGFKPYENAARRSHSHEWVRSVEYPHGAL
jgi:hypothetical protein